MRKGRNSMVHISYWGGGDGRCMQSLGRKTSTEVTMWETGVDGKKIYQNESRETRCEVGN
jgi:hypothetical protein